jgi:hypothetical protein
MTLSMWPRGLGADKPLVGTCTMADGTSAHVVWLLYASGWDQG